MQEQSGIGWRGHGAHGAGAPPPRPRAPELDRLLARGRLRRFGAHETIFHRGDDGGFLALIVRGVVRIELTSPDGRNLALRLMKPGELLGEIAVLDGSTRTADAVAAGEVELLVVRAEDVRRIMRDDPDVAAYFIRMLCARLRNATDSVEGHALNDLPQRLATLLLALSEPVVEGGRRAVVAAAPSQGELARLVGGTREAVNRRMRRLVESGAISRDARRIVIPDVRALQAERE